LFENRGRKEERKERRRRRGRRKGMQNTWRIKGKEESDLCDLFLPVPS